MWHGGGVTSADRRARFEAIAGEVMEPLRRFLARRTDPATAEDVLAEALLVCWRRIDEVPDEALPWVYGVARNCLANAERSARRQHRVAARIATVDPPVQVDGEPRSAAEDTAEDTVAAALARLSERDAELVRLWAWEQLGAAEIADVLGITPNAASIRLHRAREKLRAELRKIPAAAGHEEQKEGRNP
ncbi:RNA polymerase sigma factor [soil metagenome]